MQKKLRCFGKLKLSVRRTFQDDFLDCFGDPSVTGKIGTDIEDNKCSWLIVQALQRASPEQKVLLQVATVVARV